jgi:hypothetical protein
MAVRLVQIHTKQSEGEEMRDYHAGHRQGVCMSRRIKATKFNNYVLQY